MAEPMGGGYPFVLAARTVADALKGTGGRLIDNVDVSAPAKVLARRLSDGTYSVLAVDFVEGLSDAARTPCELNLRRLPLREKGRSSGPTWGAIHRGRADREPGIPQGLPQGELEHCNGEGP